MKITVQERYNAATYQHLYQKGFRAGRRYESRVLAPVMRGQQLAIQALKERRDWLTEQFYQTNSERVAWLGFSAVVALFFYTWGAYR